MWCARPITAFVSGLGVLLACPTLAKERKIDSFAAAGPWVFDYADDHCAFRRSFESGDERFFVEFRQFFPGVKFDLIVMSDSRSISHREIRYRFAPEEEVREPSLSFGMNGDEGSKGIFTTGYFAPFRPDTDDDADTETPEAAELAAWAEKVEALEMLRGFRKPIRLETGRLSDLLVVRDHCISTLLKEWGVDPERYASQSRRAEPKDIDRWSKYVQRRYPNSALNRGKVGTTRLRLTIGAQGGITNCVSLATIADQALVDTACSEVMDHGVFEPALDADGEPMVSVYVLSVSYVL